MKDDLSISCKHELTEEDILDVLTTAIEGGIGYWCCLLNDDPDWIKARADWKLHHNNETPCYCDVAYQVLMSGKSVKLEDIEEDKIYELDMDKFKKGCSVYIEKTGHDIHCALRDGAFDAEDADLLIQYALFGECVFG